MLFRMRGSPGLARLAWRKRKSASLHKPRRAMETPKSSWSLLRAVAMSWRTELEDERDDRSPVFGASRLAPAQPTNDTAPRIEAHRRTLSFDDLDGFNEVRESVGEGMEFMGTFLGIFRCELLKYTALGAPRVRRPDIRDC